MPVFMLFCLLYTLRLVALVVIQVANCNSSLPTGQNLVRWNLSPTSDCRNCLQRETLLHVVARCKSYLDRFTWRHDSVLNFLTKTLLPVKDAKSTQIFLAITVRQ